MKFHQLRQENKDILLLFIGRGYKKMLITCAPGTIEVHIVTVKVHLVMLMHEIQQMELAVEEETYQHQEDLAQALMQMMKYVLSFDAQLLMKIDIEL
jgi:hypothetical protein